MRVVVVCDYAHVNGGAAKVALTSARALAEAGHDVHVFCAVGPVDDTLLSHERIRVECLDIPVFTQLGALASLQAGTWNREAGQRLGKALGSYDPSDTVVHFHQFRDALTPAVVKAAHEMGFPTVYTAHDFSIGCPYGSFFDASTQGVCRRKGMSPECVQARCNETGRVRKLAVLYKHRIQMQRGEVPACFDAVAFVSELSREVLTPYLYPDTEATIVPNPIDAVQGEPAEVPENAPAVFVGGLIGVKDPVAAAVAAKEAGVSIEFVGDGPLAEDVRKANTDATLHGWVSAEKVREILRRARALVFPSIWMETQGMVVYEALANGIPSICSDVTAAAKAVTESGGGVLFRAGDADDLARKLREYGDVGLAREAGRRGYEWFWKNPPTMERHLAALLGVYEQASRRRSARA